MNTKDFKLLIKEVLDFNFQSIINSPERFKKIDKILAVLSYANIDYFRNFTQLYNIFLEETSTFNAILRLRNLFKVQYTSIETQLLYVFEEFYNSLYKSQDEITPAKNNCAQKIKETLEENDFLITTLLLSEIECILSLNYTEETPQQRAEKSLEQLSVQINMTVKDRLLTIVRDFYSADHCVRQEIKEQRVLDYIESINLFLAENNLFIKDFPANVFDTTHGRYLNPHTILNDTETIFSSIEELPKNSIKNARSADYRPPEKNSEHSEIVLSNNKQSFISKLNSQNRINFRQLEKKPLPNLGL